MAILACTLKCLAGGFSKITVNIEGEQTGSNKDDYMMRIKRVKVGSTSPVYLPGEVRFVMTGHRDIRSFTFIDPNVPSDGDYTYTLQVKRMDGGGQFYLTMMVAEHFKR